MDVDNSHKYHFRGELPKIVDGLPSRLARRDIPGKDRNKIYSDIYSVIYKMKYQEGPRRLQNQYLFYVVYCVVKMMVSFHIYSISMSGTYVINCTF